MIPLITEDQIREKVLELAAKIARDNSSGQLHVLFILKGAFIFCADLVRALSNHGIDVTLDYVIAKSYSGKKSTGEVKLSADVDIEGKHVLVVEDIIDTGKTLKILKEELTKKRPSSLRIACLLDKPSRREIDMEPEYIGFEIEDKFVVGYGIDCDEKSRCLPFIATIE